MSYRSALATLPRPSSSQVAAFVEYVFRAHSWYKHLPRFLPGKTFSFYLDPAVGHAVVSRPDGSLSLVERLEGEAFFHYNEMPTREYHARFGALAYHVAAGMRVALVAPDGLTRWGGTEPLVTSARVRVCSPEHGFIAVPDEVLDAGSVELTGVIHPLTDCSYEWERYGPLATRPWPEESGGRAALEGLDEIVERSRNDIDGSIGGAFAVQESTWQGTPRHAFDVYEHIAPERGRQRRAAIAAVEAMLDVVFTSR